MLNVIGKSFDLCMAIKHLKRFALCFTHTVHINGLQKVIPLWAANQKFKIVNQRLLCNHFPNSFRFLMSVNEHV